MPEPFNAIPVMDDPLGKHWDQPADVRFIPMDDTHALLTSLQVSQLCSYDCTLPTGVYPGKCWQRREPKGGDFPNGRHLFVWYGAETPEGRCPILFREILVIDTDAKGA